MTIYPLHNNRNQLVGWITPEEHIFDTQMTWVAFLQNGHAWGCDDCSWLGQMNGLICLDHAGKPVAFHGGEPVIEGMQTRKPTVAGIRLNRPARPSQPPMPIPPRWRSAPFSGWSELSFIEWFNQKPPKIKKPQESASTKSKETTGECTDKK